MYRYVKEVYANEDTSEFFRIRPDGSYDRWLHYACEWHEAGDEFKFLSPENKVDMIAYGYYDVELDKDDLLLEMI
jgi:hypothetical protein